MKKKYDGTGMIGTAKRPEDAMSARTKLLRIANRSYPDGLIAQAFDLRRGKEIAEDVGDTLALFIGREIISVSDESEKMNDNAANVCSALERAEDEIRAVRMAIMHKYPEVLR